MSWTIERHGRTAVVTMTTNPVNAQNRAFFADLHDAFDRLESEHPDSPVVLTGQRQRFSAGLDLGEHFPLFAGPPEGVADWFAAYRATNMRLFTYPRPTVAAVNGHAFAGGLITAAVCDRRLAVDAGARFSLNEVPIGIPMPAVYVRMLTYAWGEQAAARASLFGESFDQDQARALGMVDELLPADQLLDRAVAVAGSVPRGLPGGLRLHQARRPGPGAARHRRAVRPARPRAPAVVHHAERPPRPPPLLAATQGHRTHLVTILETRMSRPADGRPTWTSGSGEDQATS